MAGTVLIVDAANVVGSRPDGWWRDRVGAAERLLVALADHATRSGHPALAGDGPNQVVVVLEGQARGARDECGPGLTVVRAERDGDGCIVEQVRERAGQDVLVVTSDRELQGRVVAEGAQVQGAGWLLRQLDACGPAVDQR
ncbi:NYN domain-containing protein [Actinotalea sp. BY-33]|uniref:NYN domain-containing protein n=1 Tax=Actinotalea soli TaxID=2819234 RepID=A0A939LS97_9CELL|nr:NYN domain-containing protein [Actinotalea soli]MBO1753194.1 NYN domain-containing protein [Actinotalea soli]